MWGAPQINNNLEYTKKLKHICDILGEDKNYYTEPDIIIITKSTSVFIEVKVKSGNDQQSSDNKNYDKYLLNEFYKDIEAAKKSSYYELIRNWTIGKKFSENNFKPINLAPKKEFYNKNADDSKSLNALKKSLKGSENFIQLSWESVLQKLNELETSGIEKWFCEELRSRIPLQNF